MACFSVSSHFHLAFQMAFSHSIFRWLFQVAFRVCTIFALSHVQIPCGINGLGFHFTFLPGRAWGAMDRAAISQLTLDQLGHLIHQCLQEFGRRLGRQTDETTVFRVTLGSVQPGEPITEALFPSPPTPPLPAFLCCHRCSRCSSYCYDQNPAHTEHLCEAHASEQSTHAPW